MVKKKGSWVRSCLMYTIVKSSCSTATLEWRQQTPHEGAAEWLWLLGKNLIEKHLKAYTIAITFLQSKTESLDP